MWYLQYPDRYAAELAALRAAEAEGAWLEIEGVRLDSEMRVCLNLSITAGSARRGAVLRYPQTFPFTPPTVSPHNAERWSGHQYGRGGELCLEYGPDNWRADCTGADMVRSARRLLTMEATDGGRVVIPSRHQTTPGQDLRFKWGRLLVTLPMAKRFAVAPRCEPVKVEFSGLNHEETWVLVPARLTTLAGEDWRDPSIPPLVNFATTWEGLGYGLPHGVALPHFATASALTAFLTEQGFHSPEDHQPGPFELVLVWHDKGNGLFWLRRECDEVVSFAPVTSIGGQRLDPEHGILAGKSVGIVGCGALGSKLAMSVARAGVRRFVLVDDDVLLPENLVRHDLDWISVGEHKAAALARRLKLVAPGTTVMIRLQRLGAQEASGAIDGVLLNLQECDLIVDATAAPGVFNLLSSVATAKTLVWAEVFGGGFGGLIARSRYGVDASPQEVRSRIEGWCAEQGAPALRPAADYGVTADSGPMIADDADVGVIAAWAARFCIDLLLDRTPSSFPNSAYLIGLRAGWLFTQPFHTIPLDLGGPSAAPPIQAPSTDAVAAVLELFKLRPDAPTSSP